MFDVGFWELSIIGVVALVIVGPERLPGLARTVGLWVGKGRRMIADVKRDIDQEIRASEHSELASLKKDIQDAGKEVTKVKDSLKEKAGVDEVKDTFKDTFKDVKPVSESLKKDLDEIESSAQELSADARKAKAAVDEQARAVAETDHGTKPVAEARKPNLGDPA